MGKTQPTGQQLRLRGLARTAAKHAGILKTIKSIARGLALNGRVISSDDVRQFMVNNGWTDAELSRTVGNAMGLLFSGDEWVPVGFTASKRPSAHGRTIRTWKLKGITDAH